LTRTDPFAIDWTRSAQRSLETLPSKVAIAIVELVYGPMAEDPKRVGKPLRFELVGRWSARRGSYRVIYRIDDESRVVTVEVVAHRSDAYRLS
jgi:mRNA-degrading endonuclease RelE of RelBE toxin-antitoxin system